MPSRPFNVATAVSSLLLAAVVVGTACHAAFCPHQRSLVTWETSTHRYELGFKVLGVQLARGGHWQGDGISGVTTKADFGNWLFLFGAYDVIAASGETSHHLYVHSGGLPLVVPTLLPTLWLLRRRRVRRRIRRGLCPACGYDVRASPGRCPECGSATPKYGAVSY
jgi:hypothetical protein